MKALEIKYAQLIFITIVCMTAAGIVVGCTEQNTSNTSSNTSPVTAPASPEEATQGAITQEPLQETTAEPSSQPSATAASDASSPLIAGTAQTTGFTGQDIACDTAEHFTEILWQEGQPEITFAKKPDDTTLNEASPVTIATNSDGSRTYGYTAEVTVYSRFYLDGSCLIQALDNQGNSTVEAFGRTAPIGAIAGVNIPVQPETSASAAEPSLEPLTLICSGTIQDEVDFTVYFERQSESGFNRVDLRPHDTSDVLTTTLMYKTRTAKGEGIWQGSVSETTDVTLVHLSRSLPAVGDEVSVGYGGRWGKAICEEG